MIGRVIRQGLARYLAACDSASVSERGDEEGVDGRFTLEDVEDGLDTFVYE